MTLNVEPTSVAKGALLFEPFELPNIPLRNRVVMAPMTRSRAESDGCANALMALYYMQRASAGLIVSEAISISAQGVAYISTPGLYTVAQIESWKPVTEAVHNAGGKIFAQLLHGGRIGHPALSGGLPTVAPSALQPEGFAYLLEGRATFPQPDELTADEIARVVGEYAQAAWNAIEAGFDGVEIHGANGYLPNQFLADSTNARTDSYGGSPENKGRFVLEVVDAVIGAVGSGATGIRFSPVGTNNGVFNSNPYETYGPLVKALASRDLAYLHLMEGPKQTANAQQDSAPVAAQYRPLYPAILIASGGMELGQAEEILASGTADLVAFGAAFVANPDLVARLRQGLPLAVAQRDTFYQGGEAGYTTYPAIT
jgi:N-ethylmaleimide reductase